MYNFTFINLSTQKKWTIPQKPQAAKINEDETESLSSPITIE